MIDTVARPVEEHKKIAPQLAIIRNRVRAFRIIAVIEPSAEWRGSDTLARCTNSSQRFKNAIGNQAGRETRQIQGISNYPIAYCNVFHIGL